MKSIDRREALKRTSILIGGAISAPTMMGILNGCTVSNEPDWIPEFFDTDQALAIMDMSDILIPATDTPGARDVGVPKFIESLVKDVYSNEARQKFMSGFQSFMTATEEQNGKTFSRLDEEEKIELVKQMNAAALENPSGSTETFYRQVKEMTVSGFCMSEAGATQVLKYDKVPGEYKGCIPYDEVGGVWAT